MFLAKSSNIVITLGITIMLTACATQEETAPTVTASAPAAQAAPEPARQPTLAPRDRMMRVALQQRGRPYRYGGTTPDGFDASGLVYYCHQQVELVVPRDFREQLTQGRPVAKEKIRPGDLLFFALGTDKPNHVGIYLGANKFMHAPATHTKVIMSDIRAKKWAKALVRGGRL